MNKDFRRSYPLWNMAFLIILAVMAVGFSSRYLTVTVEESAISIQSQSFGGILLFAAVVAYLVLIIIYLIQLRRFNRLNPDKKLSLFSIRPPEFMEEDEGMTYITRKAAQKVYTLMTWALPFLAIIVMLLPVSRLVIAWGILAVAFG